MAPAAANNIILYHYAYSPYARRLVWYLALRGIPYAQCMQPGIMPRPDVAKLGIKYRRIPILSIGRDVYLDSRLALQKLETAFPDRPKLGASGEQLALERLLESWNVDAGMFTAATQLLPIDLPFLTQPSYYVDRGEYLGIKLTREAMLRGRPEGLTKIRSGMEFLESTLLADGREWILKTEGPSLADIEAVWPFHWIAGIPDALPADLFSAERYPKVYAWIARFQAAVSAAKRKVEKPKTLSGDEAMDLILGSPYFESAGPVDKEDPLVTAHGLKKGDGIVVWPTDTGSSHKDTGTLVSIDWREVVFEAKGEKDTVRVHAPRHGFRVRTPRQDNGQASL